MVGWGGMRACGVLAEYSKLRAVSFWYRTQGNSHSGIT